MECSNQKSKKGFPFSVKEMKKHVSENYNRLEGVTKKEYSRSTFSTMNRLNLCEFFDTKKNELKLKSVYLLKRKKDKKQKEPNVHVLKEWKTIKKNTKSKTKSEMKPIARVSSPKKVAKSNEKSKHSDGARTIRSQKDLLELIDENKPKGNRKTVIQNILKTAKNPSDNDDLDKHVKFQLEDYPYLYSAGSSKNEIMRRYILPQDFNLLLVDKSILFDTIESNGDLQKLVILETVKRSEWKSNDRYSRPTDRYVLIPSAKLMKNLGDTEFDLWKLAPEPNSEAWKDIVDNEQIFSRSVRGNLMNPQVRINGKVITMEQLKMITNTFK